jgi:hypothetical protein
MAKKSWLKFFLASATIPNAKAQAQIDVAGALSTVGEWLNNVFSNEYATFGVTIIVLTILIRSIFAASLKKVKIFEGEGGTGINTFGSTISWTLAILASIGLYYIKADQQIGTFLRNILGPSAMYAAIILTIVLFWWYKGATGSTKWALLLTGASCMVLSTMVQWPMLATTGVFMMIGALFWLVGGAARGRGASSTGSGSTYRNLRNEEDATKNLSRTLQKEDQSEKNIEKDEMDAESIEREIADLEKKGVGIEDIVRQMINALATPENAQVLQPALKRQKEILAKIVDKSKPLKAIETKVKEHLEEMKDMQDSGVNNLKKAFEKIGRDQKELKNEQNTKIKDTLADLKRIHEDITILKELAHSIKKTDAERIADIGSLISLVGTQNNITEKAICRMQTINEAKQGLRKAEDEKETISKKILEEDIKIRRGMKNINERLPGLRSDIKTAEQILESLQKIEQKEQKETLPSGTFF